MAPSASRPMKARSRGSSATVQARPEGVRRLVHVVAVEVHAGLEPQRIAGAEATGGDPEGIEPAPRGHRIRRRHHHLEPVLARVPGPRHEPAVELARGEGAERERRGGTRPREQLRRLGARLRALDREHGEIGALGHFDAEWLRVASDPEQVLVARRGIHHRAEGALREVIHDEVVDDAAALVQHAAVERPAGRFELRHVVGEQLLEEGPHLRALQVDDAHVRDVEHARGAAHGVVLADLRAVLHRHVPAAEVDHAGAELLVQLE